VEPDDLEAQFVRSTRRRRAVLTVVVTAAIASPFAYVWWQRHKVVVKIEAREAEEDERKRAEEVRRNAPLSSDEMQKLRQLAPSTRQALLDMRDAWQRSVTPEALDAVLPTEARCRHVFAAPTIEAGESYIKYSSIDGNYFGNLQYDVFPAREPLPDPGFAQRLAEVDTIAAHIAAGKLVRPDLEALATIGRRDDDLFVIADERVEPIFVSDGYIGGRIVGAAYLYSYAQGRVICAGEIFAKNGPKIEISYRYSPGDQQSKQREAAMAVLTRDMEVALRRAIATSMRAVE
jgi:hypothetical protein